MEGVQPTKPGSLDDPASKADDNKRINEELDNLNGGGTSPRKRSKSSNAGSGAGGGVAPIQAQYDRLLGALVLVTLAQKIFL